MTTAAAAVLALRAQTVVQCTLELMPKKSKINEKRSNIILLHANNLDMIAVPTVTH